MGLNPRHLKEFQAKRIYSSVLLENIPQLCVQIYFLTLLGGFDEATFVALLSSSISVILSVVDIWSAKRLVSVMDQTKNDGLVNINTIEFIILSNEEIENKKPILLTKPRALAKAIAETLIVDSRNVEIYQLLASTHGIKIGFNVYAINYDCDKMIDDLIDEQKKLQLLITNYWHLKQFPNVSEFHQGTMANGTSGILFNGQGVEEEYSIGNNRNQIMSTKGIEINKLHANYAQYKEHGVNGLHHIRLSRMKTMLRNKVKAFDPEILNHSKVVGYELMERGDVTPINDIDEITDNDDVVNSPTKSIEINLFDNSNDDDIEPDFKDYMNSLHKYAYEQNEIYESHPMSKESPLKLLNDESNTQYDIDDDDTADTDDDNDDLLWMQYRANIKQLLEKKMKLQAKAKKDSDDVILDELMDEVLDESVDKVNLDKMYIVCPSNLQLSVNAAKSTNTPSIPSNELNEN